jgi:hypothetical protein
VFYDSELKPIASIISPLYKYEKRATTVTFILESIEFNTGNINTTIIVRSYDNTDRLNRKVLSRYTNFFEFNIYHDSYFEPTPILIKSKWHLS